MKRLLALAVFALAACSPAPPPAPAASSPPSPAGPKTLGDLAMAYEWRTADAAKLSATLKADATRILKPLKRSETITAFAEAGYQCMYGEASDGYPDPMQVCKRSFGTPECQLDWEISTTAAKGMTDEVDASFTRDCIGTDRDYPEPKTGDMDKNLATPSFPAPSSSPQR